MMTSLVAIVTFLALSIQMAIVMAQGTVDAETSSVSTSTNSSIADDGERSKIDDEKTLAPFLIRLHLIRHGETHANVQNIVLGQKDSPLTDNGVAVARLAAASDIINGKRLRYWRTYCSDLHRAHRTAKIVLGLEDGSSDVDLIVDSRLRELAKGAREGYLKKLSYEEALAMRREEAGGNANNAEIDVPKLESIDEAWGRAAHWIDSLIKDASDEYYSCGADNDSESDPKIYDIFSLSHSALIRTMISKMVDAELPSDYATTNEGSLRIPNLSRTIIDVRPYNKVSHESSSPKKWTPSLFRLTDVSHLNSVSHNGPPYL